MAVAEDIGKEDIKKFLPLVSDLMNISKENVWIDYDKEADVMYINFKKPSDPDDSELTDDDIIIRYEKDEIVGLTVLHASKRNAG